MQLDYQSKTKKKKRIHYSTKFQDYSSATVCRHDYNFQKLRFLLFKNNSVIILLPKKKKWKKHTYNLKYIIPNIYAQYSYNNYQYFGKLE